MEGEENSATVTESNSNSGTDCSESEDDDYGSDLELFDYADLIEAIEVGDLERVTADIEAEPLLLRTTIDLENGWTPLHYACHNDRAEIVSYILETERNILSIGGQVYRVVHLVR